MRKMKSIAIAVALLLLTGATIAISTQLYLGTSYLKDSVTKLAVPNATITVIEGNPIRCSPATDEHGKFVCEFSVPRDYCKLKFEKDNYTTVTANIYGGDNYFPSHINSNVKIDPFGWFVGTVKTTGGVPIQGALVSVSGPYYDTTEEDGSYQIFLPAGSPYGLTASSANCLIEESKVGLAITAGQGNVQNFSLPGCE